MLLLLLRSGHGRAEVFQLDLSLFELLTNFSDDIGQVMLNVGEKQFGKLVRQHTAAKVAWGHGRVDRMRAEKELLFFDGLFYWNLVDNIFLSTVFHADVAKSERDILVHDHTLGVGAAIHDVNLGDHTHRTDALWV